MPCSVWILSVLSNPNIEGALTWIQATNTQATQNGALFWWTNSNVQSQSKILTTSDNKADIGFSAQRHNPIYDSSNTTVKVDSLCGLALIRAYQWHSEQGINTHLVEIGFIQRWASRQIEIDDAEGRLCSCCFGVKCRVITMSNNCCSSLNFRPFVVVIQVMNRRAIRKDRISTALSRRRTTPIN